MENHVSMHNTALALVPTVPCYIVLKRSMIDKQRVLYQKKFDFIWKFPSLSDDPIFLIRDYTAQTASVHNCLLIQYNLAGNYVLFRYEKRQSSWELTV